MNSEQPDYSPSPGLSEEDAKKIKEALSGSVPLMSEFQLKAFARPLHCDAPLPGTQLRLYQLSNGFHVAIGLSVSYGDPDAARDGLGPLVWQCSSTIWQRMTHQVSRGLWTAGQKSIALSQANAELRGVGDQKRQSVVRTKMAVHVFRALTADEIAKVLHEHPDMAVHI